MSLFTGFAGLGTGTSTFTEQTGTGYVRQAITLAPTVTGSNRHQTNSAAVSFTASATWSNASTQIALFATATSANPLVWWNKVSPVAALASGASFTINANSMNLFLADAASAVGAQTAWSVGDVIGADSASQPLTVGAPLLISDGVMTVGFPVGVIGHLISANANSTSDQQFVMSPLVGGNFIVTKIIATNASISLTTAVGGVYPAASKGGTALVAASQAYTTLTSSAPYESLTLASATNTTVYSSAPFLSLTTAQGAAATVDLYLVGTGVF
jgi:hypothetical protein